MAKHPATTLAKRKVGHQDARSLDVLRARLERLISALAFAREHAGMGKGVDDAVDAVRAFAECLKATPAWNAELERRAGFVRDRTGPETAFFATLQSVRGKVQLLVISGASPATVDVKRSLTECKPSPTECESPCSLASSLRRLKADLRLLLRAATLSNVAREAIKDLIVSATSIEKEADDLHCDGAVYIRNPDLLAASLSFAAKPVLDAVARAAASLVEWATSVEVDSAAEDDAWVPANGLWLGHFKTYRKAKTFLDAHPDMWRKRSKNRLEIHAGRWTTYWTAQEARVSAAMGEPESIADDPEISRGMMKGMLDRVKSLRGEKKAKEKAKK